MTSCSPGRRHAGTVTYAAGMRVALCQLPINPDPAVNLDRVREALADAAGRGADLAVFPEATQARFGSDLQAIAEPLDGPFGTGLAEAARATGVALVAGVFEPAPDGRVYNTVAAYDAAGVRVAAYRKIHLYDALGEQESAVVAPGAQPVVADLCGVRVGIMTEARFHMTRFRGDQRERGSRRKDFMPARHLPGDRCDFIGHRLVLLRRGARGCGVGH